MNTTPVSEVLVRVSELERRVIEREQSLRASETRLRRLVDTNIIGVALADWHGRVLEANDVLLKTVGYTREELAAGHIRWDCLTPPEWRESTEKAVAELHRSGVSAPREKEYFRKDGTRVPVLVGASVLDETQGILVGFVLDITDRKHAEAARAHLAAIVESCSDAIFSQTPDGLITTWNSAAERLYGYTRSEVLNQPSSMLVAAAYFDEQQSLQREIVRGRLVEHLEMVHVRRDGRRICVSLTVSPIRDAAGQIIGSSVIARDVTEQQRVRRLIQESEQRLRAVVDTARDAIVSADCQGSTTAWNPAAEEMFGYGKADIIGEPLLRLMPTRFRRAHATAFRRARESNAKGFASRTIELAGLRRDGTEFPLELSLSTWMVEGQRYFTAIIRDITQRKQSEKALKSAHSVLAVREQALGQALTKLEQSHQQLQDAQLQLIEAGRMESVGRLAAGVAHEVKNPLAVIRLGVEYLSGHLPTTDEHATLLKHMRSAVQRADAVCHGLMNFATPHELELKETNLNAVVEQTLLFVKHNLARARVILRTKLARELPLLKIDPVKIEQVLINLLMNGIDAMPAGGTLTVRTRVSSRPIHGEGGSAVGHVRDSAVVIEIEDTGGGIAPQSSSKIFDPFFTTKPTGKGTGLGLPISKAIIELHGGSLEVCNRKTGGVTATIRLPLREAV